MISYDDLTLSGRLSEETARWDTAAALIPSDKSISHRMILFATLSERPVRIANLNEGRAVTLLIDALRGLGVAIDYEPGSGCATVRGHLAAGNIVFDQVMDFGPSSAAARLMIGVLCGLGSSGYIIDGDETLRARPFDWIVDPLREMGGRFEYLGREGVLPIRICPGSFTGGSVQTHIGSAQAVSALLFAGIAGRRPVEVCFPVFARNHTQIMARNFGDTVEEEGKTVRYVPQSMDIPENVTIPGDPSAAAYLAALFWMSNRQNPRARLRIKGLCLNPSRMGFFEWMRGCGFEYDQVETGTACGETVGDLVLRGGGRLQAQGLSGGRMIHSMIDEIPLAAAIACQLLGDAVFDDLFELTFKETNRITATCSLLSALGLRAEPDGYRINIRGGQRPEPAGDAPSFGDHRLSMTACVTLLSNGLGGLVTGGKCFKTSFPDFGALLETLCQEQKSDVHVALCN